MDMLDSLGERVMTMGKTSEHTPTPWRAANKSPTKVCDGIGHKVASCTTHAGGDQWRTHEQAAANAAFIIRAVNNHEALVAMLRKVTRYGDDPASISEAREFLSSLDV
jgi:hypothetical protein